MMRIYKNKISFVKLQSAKDSKPPLHGTVGGFFQAAQKAVLGQQPGEEYAAFSPLLLRE